jgi:hypothetical protein
MSLLSSVNAHALTDEFATSMSTRWVGRSRSGAAHGSAPVSTVVGKSVDPHPGRSANSRIAVRMTSSPTAQASASGGADACTISRVLSGYAASKPHDQLTNSSRGGASGASRAEVTATSTPSMSRCSAQASDKAGGTVATFTPMLTSISCSPSTVWASQLSGIVCPSSVSG